MSPPHESEPGAGATSGDPAPGRSIEIEDGVVRRPAHAWTPTVHAFLRHLRAAGLEGVPEPLSITQDARGRAVELLRWLPGESGREGWFAQHSTKGLVSAARLLRRVHDASVGWVPPPDARWAADSASGPGASGPGAGDPGATGLWVAGPEQVMCHGDPGPWNFVWDGEEAIGLIDWDFLHPAPRLDDVAYALRWFAPARHDEHALEWHHFPQVPDRRARIRAFVRAYAERPDVDLGGVDLVEAMAARVEATVRTARALAAEGIEPQATWARDGSLDEETAEATWIREHRHLLQ